MHVWDGTVPIETLMRALDDQVRAGKVGHLGISDAPAWVVSRANAIAEERGWTPFSAVQAPYSLIRRDLERELLPMSRALGLTLTAWAPLGGGVLSGKYNRGGAEGARYSAEGVPRQRLEIAELVGQIAGDLGCTPAQLAIAWLRQRGSNLVPLLGARNPGQLRDNLGALAVRIPPEPLARLDEATRIELGFPQDFLGTERVRGLIFGDRLADIEIPGPDAGQEVS